MSYDDGFKSRMRPDGVLDIWDGQYDNKSQLINMSGGQKSTERIAVDLNVGGKSFTGAYDALTARRMQQELLRIQRMGA